MSLYIKYRFNYRQLTRRMRSNKRLFRMPGWRSMMREGHRPANSGKGTIGKLLNDDGAIRIRRLMTNLKEILQKINQAGSVGKLLNIQELYRTADTAKADKVIEAGGSGPLSALG